MLKRNNILSFVVMMLFPLIPYAQMIRGKILSISGDGVQKARVELEGTGLYSVTDSLGHFQFEQTNTGKYRIWVTAKGYQSVSRTFELQAKEKMVVIKLHDASLTLNEVYVGGQANRQKDRISNMAARLPVNNLENPQVIHSVSALTIKQQSIIDVDGLMRNLPGVVKTWGSTTSYYSSRGFNVRNYVRNGISGFVSADADMANIEQLIAIKGPSGTLFGSSLVSYGGVLNRVTKKPFDSLATEVSLQMGSYGLSRSTMDMNLPINPGRSVLLRMNASHQSERSFQDSGFSKSIFISTSLGIKISPRLSVSLEAEFHDKRGSSLLQISPRPPKQREGANGPDHPFALPFDYYRSYSNNIIALRSLSKSIFFETKYQLSGGWVLQTNILTSIAGNAGDYLTFNMLKDSALIRNVSHYPGGSNSVTQFQQNLNGHFNVGGLRNRFVAGLDFYHANSLSKANALNGRGGRRSFDTLYVNGKMQNYLMISPADILEKLKGFSPNRTVTSSNTYAFYASNVTDVTSRLSAMLSIRFDYFSNMGSKNLDTDITLGRYRQSSLSPKLGLVYQILKKRVSLFANYNNGFQNVAPVNQPDGSVSIFSPQRADQLEIGVKAEIPGILTATCSAYRILVKRILRPEEERVDFTVQDGSQRSQGIELDLSSSPFKNLSLNAGYSYNNSILLKAAPAVNGLRPVNSGPVHTANFYLNYGKDVLGLGVISIGLGGNFNGRNLIINNVSGGQFFTNSYHNLYGGLSYSVHRLRMSLNMENITNVKYYHGGFGLITPGMPRRTSLTCGMRL